MGRQNLGGPSRQQHSRSSDWGITSHFGYSTALTGQLRPLYKGLSAVAEIGYDPSLPSHKPARTTSQAPRAIFVSTTDAEGTPRPANRQA